MNTHTPGPWAVRPITHVAGPSYGITKGEGGTWIARCHPLNGENAEEVKANAQLMAAAPDLLAALESFMECVHDDGYGECCGCDFTVEHKAGTAAIAKAKGEA